jgi:hypothetical protein
MYMVVYYYDLTIKPSRVHTVNYVFVMCFLWHTTNYDFAMCFLCTRQNNNFLSSAVRIRYGHYGLWCAFYWHTAKNWLCRVRSIGKLRRRGFAVCLLEAHGKRRQKIILCPPNLSHSKYNMWYFILKFGIFYIYLLY